MFQDLAADPSAADVATLRAELADLIDRLDTLMVRARDAAGESSGSSEANDERVFEVLAAYRGLSVALVDYAEHARGIDWRPWREERFA